MFEHVIEQISLKRLWDMASMANGHPVCKLLLLAIAVLMWCF